MYKEAEGCRDFIIVKDFYKLIKEPSSKKLGIVLFNDSSQTIRTNFETRNEQLH